MSLKKESITELFQAKESEMVNGNLATEGELKDSETFGQLDNRNQTFIAEGVDCPSVSLDSSGQLDTCDEVIDLTIFPRHIAELIEELHEKTNSPVNLLVASMLGLTSASIGAGVKMATYDAQEVKANLFILVGARSGIGKGKSYKVLRSVFDEVCSDMEENWKGGEKARIEKELEGLKDDGKPNKDTSKRIEELEKQSNKSFHVIHKTPSEAALGIELEKHPLGAIALHSEEARTELEIMIGKGGQKDLMSKTAMLSLFSGECLEALRVSRNSTSNPVTCGSSLWMVQPDLMAEFAGDAEIAKSGLSPRFLCVSIDCEIPYVSTERKVIRGEILGKWRAVLRSLLEIRYSGSQSEVIISDDVISLIAQQTNKMIDTGRAGGVNADIPSFISRYGEQLSKLVLVLHLLRCHKKCITEPVDSESFRNAVRLMDFFMSQQEQFLFSSRNNKLDDDAMRLLNQKQKKPLDTFSRNYKAISLSKAEALLAVQKSDSLFIRKDGRKEYLEIKC